MNLLGTIYSPFLMELRHFYFYVIIWSNLKGDMAMLDKLKNYKPYLDSRIKDADNVFITDFDAIGSAFGLYTLAESMNKPVYIVVDDEASKIEPGVKKIIDDNKSEYCIIKKMLLYR